MKYITYLLIKQAMWEDSLLKEATDRTYMAAKRDAKKHRGAARGEAKREGIEAAEKAKTSPRVAEGAGKANGVGFGAIFTHPNDPLAQAKIDNAELAGQLHGANMALNKAQKDVGFLKGKRKELEEANKVLGYDLTRSNMNLEGMRNNRDALYDAAEANRSFGNDIHGRLLTTNRAIGATGGALIGGGLGYAGSNWASKKLGLQGPDVSRKRRIADIALRTVGTAGGAALGGYGGYRLGGYLTPSNTMGVTPSKYVEITGP